ncbi:MAG: hypothetical protein AAGJ81_02860 [Verrucomicrobiota bacterium]
MKVRLKDTNCILVLALIPVVANGFIDVSLTGVTDYDEWDNLTISNPQIASVNAGAGDGFGSFPGDTPWPEAIESVLTFGTAESDDDDPTGDAAFGKISGNGYPATISIYGAPFSFIGPHIPATHNVFDTNLIPDIETIIFQVRIGQGSDGWIDGLPILTLNGGDVFANNTDYFFERTLGVEDTGFGDSEIKEFSFMWDLASYTDPITEYDIQWTMSGTSTTILALELNSGDTFSPTAVPEPSVFSFFAAIGAGVLVLTRRRRVAS